MPNYVSNNPGALSARRYLDINTKALAKFQNQLSSGSLISDPTENPASSAIGILIQSDLQTIAQASSNAIQASALIQLGVGALAATNETLTRMQILAAQANSSTMGEGERKMFMAEYESLLSQINNNAKIEWRSTELFNGGNGLVTTSSATGAYNSVAANNASGSSLTLPNGSANNVGTLYEIIGSINSNTASNISVASNLVTFNIGSEIFAYNTESGSNYVSGDIITFTSQSDISKKIRFAVTGNLVVTDAGASGNSTGAENLINGINTALAAGDIRLAQNTSGLTRVSNWFTGGLNLNSSSGLYTGTATDAVVVQSSGASTYDVRVTIGSQVFRASAAAAPTAKGTLVLTSETEPTSKIAFNYDLSTVISSPSAEAFTSALKTLLGLQENVATTGRATFSARSVTAYDGMTVALDTTAQSGTYGLSYAVSGSTGTFTLMDGINPTLTADIDTATVSDGAVVDFGNGIKINLTSVTSFLASANKGFTTFTVDNGVNMTFQIGAKSTNTLTIQFAAANTQSLNLDGSSVLTIAQAKDTASRITTAIASINLQIAKLGGKKSQLEFISKNLDISSQNLIAAKATFTDTDIPTALMETQKYQSLVDISSSMLQQTMEKDKKLAALVQRATS